MGNIAPSERVLAAATGSLGGLGKIATVLAADTIYVRCDNTGFGATSDIDWRVKSNKKYTVQLYRARDVVDSVGITLASMGDGETGPLLNGLTYTAEDTAASAAWASRKYYTGGADDTADAVQLAALINADYAVATAGTSVAATDKLVITTDEGAHTIVAAAAADYPTGKYKLSSTVATELASIVLAINHKDNITFEQDATAFAATNPAVDEASDYALSIELIADHNTHTASTVFHYAATAAAASTAATTEETLVAQVNVARTAMLAHYADASAHGVADTTNLATVVATTAATDAATARTLVNALATAHLAHIATAKRAAGDVVTVNGLAFTAKAGAADAATRKFSLDTSADATGTSLAACVNDATYGVPGVTATNASGVVSFARDTMGDTVTVTVTNAATHPHQVMTIEAGGGVPGVSAVASGATGELGITPTWTTVLTVTEAGDRLTVTDIDCPGVYATSALGVVTVVPGTPATGGEKATVIEAQTGTGAGHCACAQTTTLAGLTVDGAAVADATATGNGTTNGTIFNQSINGWSQAYIGVTNNDALAAATFTVAATRN